MEAERWNFQRPTLNPPTFNHKQGRGYAPAASGITASGGNRRGNILRRNTRRPPRHQGHNTHRGSKPPAAGAGRAYTVQPVKIRSPPNARILQSVFRITAPSFRCDAPQFLRQSRRTSEDRNFKPPSERPYASLFLPDIGRERAFAVYAEFDPSCASSRHDIHRPIRQIHPAQDHPDDQPKPRGGGLADDQSQEERFGGGVEARAPRISK